MPTKPKPQPLVINQGNICTRVVQGFLVVLPNNSLYGPFTTQNLAIDFINRCSTGRPARVLDSWFSDTANGLALMDGSKEVHVIE